jgi:hypothetical protein
MPIIKWIREYCENLNKETKLKVHLKYFNTLSSKYIFEILKIFDEISSKNKETAIKWCYDQDDEDMLGAGKEFQSMLHFKMDFIEQNE